MKTRHNMWGKTRLHLLLSFLFILLFSSICLAEMTIYLKDGTERQVFKIVFKGQDAHLYLTDGNVLVLPVSKIDLPTSGIAAPVGTYGQTGVTGPSRPVLPKKGMPTNPERQQQLKQEWEESTRIAIATNTIGGVRKGDTVKIVDESRSWATEDTKAPSRSFSDTGRPGSDRFLRPEGSSRQFDYSRRNQKPVIKDSAYIVVYKNADGSYGKRIFDAATFEMNFRFPERVTPQKKYDVPIEQPLPSESYPPAANTPDIDSGSAPVVETSPDVESSTNTTNEKVEGVKAVSETKTRPSYVLWLVIGAAATGIGLLLFVVLRGRKSWIDTSRFASYEDDLREFEIAIWLRNGKTQDQLLEICLKKFYGDHPGAMESVTKMLRGATRGVVLASIGKQSRKSSAEAEAIYEEFQQRVQRIRDLIQEVSMKSGIKPTPEVPRESKPKPAAQRLAQPAVVVATAPAAPPKAKPPSQPNASSISVPLVFTQQSFTDSAQAKQQPASVSDRSRHGALPPYASALLAQLSFLTSREE